MTEPGPDPAALLADARTATRARRHEIARALVAPPPTEPEPDVSPLDELADAVAEKVAARLREP